MRHLPMVWTALLLLVWDPRAVGAQACPQNQFYVAGNGFFYEEYSTAPSWAWSTMSYDLIAGTLDAGHTGAGEAGANAGILVQDRYRIVGPALGTPLPIQVRVGFSGVAGGGVVFLPNLGSVCLGSSATLRLASGSSLDEETIESQYGTPCASRTIDHTLALDLQKLPGEEFVVSVSISLFAGHTIPVTAAGEISFAGLPPGYSIQSCQGYGDAPVPVARRTWGGIKQLYR